MSYKYIIIDTPNLFYRNYSIFKEQKVKNQNNQEIYSGAIQGFFRSFNKIIKGYGLENTKYYFLFDNFASKDAARKRLDSDYKINRIKYEDSYYRSLDFLALILMSYSERVFTIQVPQYESDDLPPSLICSFNKYDKVLLCSEDLDWSRCITDNIHWLQHNQIITKDKFKEKFGFIPTKEKIVLWKSITGDPSDNIQKAVKGLHNKDILYLIEKYKDIYDLLENIHKETNIIGEKFVSLFKENKARLILNYQLVDFIDISYEQLKEFIYKGTYNPKSLRYFYKTLGLQISEIDKRLLNNFPDKEEIKENNDFFQFQTIKRK